ncbi:SDR family NAD(P)-dependent oxidoreductase [Aestuariivirga sp.]|uniref:SDR family NAD(P)-dependent oxidoreductase n=1 Tax=Aestuariivirga sp. TaxID=2650926 RepID=UPI0039E256C6
MKTAIVTGGGTGIGLATSRRLLADGYRVIAGGIDQEEALPRGLEFVKTDVTKEEDLADLMARAERIDALVNSAGIIRQAREWTAADFRQVMDVNLTSNMVAGTLALPKLESARGVIVNIASMWSLFGAAGAPAYGASKGAVVSLTRAMAAAWGPRGIRVNAVAPGWVNTRLAQGAKNDPEREPKITARIPLGRWAEPDEIANVIRFLLSAEASYVHGAVVPIDGGYSIA